MAFSNPQVDASLTAQATYTTPTTYHSTFPMRIRGTWAGTITLQRSDDHGTNYDDVETWTANTVRVVEETARGGALYRLGFKTGEYTSGTAAVSTG
jgi:hypothetical protein